MQGNETSQMDSVWAPHRRAVSIGSVALISMWAFEALAVTTAMPTIAQALHGIHQYALAFGATLATSVIGMVYAGRDCDRHGPARVMQWGLLVFAAGLLIAGLATSMQVLIAGRAVQGLGSGLLGVALYSAVGQLYPPDMRPRIFALFAAAWVLPAVFGPALASFVVYALGWRWVFLSVALLLPVAAWLVLPAMRALSVTASAQNSPTTQSRLVYAVLAALAALTVHDYSQDPAGTPILQGALGVTLMVWAARQLLPAGTLSARRGLPTIIALRGLLAGSFFATEAFLPLWLVLEHGWTNAAAGLALTAGGVLWSAGSAIQARVDDAKRRQRLLRVGLVLVAGGVLGVSALALIGKLPVLVLLAWSLVGLGTGLAFPALSVLMLELSPVHQQGLNSSALQLSDALTTTAALALCGASFALQTQSPAIKFASSFACAALIAVLAALLVTCTTPAKQL